MRVSVSHLKTCLTYQSWRTFSCQITPNPETGCQFEIRWSHWLILMSYMQHPMPIVERVSCNGMESRSSHDSTVLIDGSRETGGIFSFPDSWHLYGRWLQFCWIRMDKT